jgi:hypothetical protein
MALVSQTAYPQKTSLFKKMRNLSRPEKCWVLKHPFIAKKAWNCAQASKLVCDSLLKNNCLDSDANGGKIDAFRHGYWMALLAKETSKRKAVQLGKAHEKGNYLSFKKHQTEDGTLPDKISSDMDLWNNEIGATISEKNKDRQSFELKIIILLELELSGSFKIIKKNKKGEFLDCEGKIINPEIIKGKWENNKCLVNSNYERE